MAIYTGLIYYGKILLSLCFPFIVPRTISTRLPLLYRVLLPHEQSLDLGVSIPPLKTYFYWDYKCNEY